MSYRARSSTSGARLVFDCDYDERGRTTYYGDVIRVAGQWY